METRSYVYTTKHVGDVDSRIVGRRSSSIGSTSFSAGGAGSAGDANRSATHEKSAAPVTVCLVSSAAVPSAKSPYIYIGCIDAGFIENLDGKMLLWRRR